jgi:hypothetical protein
MLVTCLFGCGRDLDDPGIIRAASAAPAPPVACCRMPSAIAWCYDPAPPSGNPANCDPAVCAQVGGVHVVPPATIDVANGICGDRPKACDCICVADDGSAQDGMPLNDDSCWQFEPTQAECDELEDSLDMSGMPPCNGHTAADYAAWQQSGSTDPRDLPNRAGRYECEWKVFEHVGACAAGGQAACNGKNHGDACGGGKTCQSDTPGTAYCVCTSFAPADREEPCFQDE